MCGIGFISPAPGSGLPVRMLTRWLLHDLASRGKDAAGVAWKRQDGTTLYRRSVGHPMKLATHLAAVSGTRSLDASGAVIIHTRFATHGDPRDNGNNHPIVRPGVALVHNGVLSNAPELFGVAKTTPDTEVDSEALAALIETSRNMDVVLRRFRKVKGSAALCWLAVTDHPDDASTVWAARLDTRPLVLGFTKRGDCIGASTEQAMTKACRTAGVKLDDVMGLPEGSVVQITDGDVAEWYTIDTGSGVQESTAEYPGGDFITTRTILPYDNTSGPFDPFARSGD